MSLGGSKVNSNVNLQDLRERAVNWPCRHHSYAKYNTVNGVEERTLYKAFGIRFDVMVFGQVRALLFKNLIHDFKSKLV